MCLVNKKNSKLIPPRSENERFTDQENDSSDWIKFVILKPRTDQAIRTFFAIFSQ